MSYETEQAEWLEGIKDGDIVRVVATAKDDERGWRNVWIYPDMEVGATGPVILSGADRHGVWVAGGGKDYQFPFFVLEKVEATDGNK
jgi:hypothetical protein